MGIPKEVKIAAKLTFESVKECAATYAFDEGDGYVCSGTDWEDDDAIAHIARAILAERNRCAEVARRFVNMESCVADDILDAIESGQ